MFTIEPCPVGSKCPAGSTAHIVCNDETDGEGAGYYQPNSAQSECLQCPAGFYCDGEKATPCPAGHYCNKGTDNIGHASKAPVECPTGTHMPFEGARYESECLDCQEGYECWQAGIDGVSKQWRECGEATSGGYYCPAGAGSAIACAGGQWCPQGAAYFFECPVGYSAATSSPDVDVTQAADQSTACKLCSEDHYCGNRGMKSGEESNCGSGFKCNEGAMAAEPHADQSGALCPEGQYCSVTEEGPQDCGVGTYNPDQGRSSCNYCPAGQLCATEAMQAPEDCPVGSWCPAQSASVTNELK